MRLIDIIITASGNLLRSKLRTFLTVIAIFIGALTLTLTNGIGSGISSYIDRQLGNLGAEDVLLIQAKQDNSFGLGSSGPQKYDAEKKTSSSQGVSQVVLTDADAAKIKKIKGLREVEPYRMATATYVEGKNGQKYQLTLSQDIEGARYDLAAGRVNNMKSGAYEAILPSTYVKSLGYKDAADAEGQMATFGVTNALGQQTTFRATIVGVLKPGIIDAGGITVNRALNQTVYDYQTQGVPTQVRDQYQAITARFDVSMSDEELTQLKERIDKQGYSANTVEDQIGVFKQVIDGIILVLNFFGAIALLAASFGIINTLLMAVQERTKEIGLMKAMGMSGPRIFLLFTGEAVMLGFWGSLIGVLAAIGIGKVVNHIASTSFLKGLVGLELLAFPWQSVVVIVAIVMAIAFLAGTLPAWRAARQNPIDSLRYE